MAPSASPGEKYSGDSAPARQNEVPSSLKRAVFPKGLLFIISQLKEAGHQAFAVGGCVRDILLGREPSDYDVTTSARAEKDIFPLFDRVQRDGWRCSLLPTGLKHGTVMVRVRRAGSGETFASEVTTFRGEGEYKDGRHPESVVFLDDVEGDLARRDFTVNAMAYDPVQGIFADPFGGCGDLKCGVIRCVGRAADRFSEDGLRALRAVRFAAVLGFSIDAETMNAIRPTLSTFSKVSFERQRDEFIKLMMSGDPARGIRLLESSGLLSVLIPEYTSLSAETQEKALSRLDALTKGSGKISLKLRLAALLGDMCPPGAAFSKNNPLSLILRRLRFSNTQITLASRFAAARHFGHSSFETDGALRRALSNCGTDIIDDLLLLALAGGVPEDEVQKLQRRIQDILSSNPPLSMNDLALNGSEIGEILGTGPGPAVGKAMAKLLEAVLESPRLNTRESLTDILKRGEAS